MVTAGASVTRSLTRHAKFTTENRFQMVNDLPLPGNPDAAPAADETPQVTIIRVDDVPGAAPGKRLSPEARRALEEAEARRRAAAPQDLPPEIDGRGGEEPTRYGDWEKKGIAVDF